jgi:hypothetical protein
MCQRLRFSSLKVAREIAAVLKDRISAGSFLLQEPVLPLPRDGRPKPLDVVSGAEEGSR